MASNKNYRIYSWEWLKYVVTLLVPAALMTLSAWHQGAFVITDRKYLLVVFSNAFFISGAFTILVGLPILIKYSNTFEKLFKGLIKLFQRFKEDSIDRKYRKLYKCKMGWDRQRHIKVWMWYINIVGVIFIAIGGVLLAAFSVA